MLSITKAHVQHALHTSRQQVMHRMDGGTNGASGFPTNNIARIVTLDWPGHSSLPKSHTMLFTVMHKLVRHSREDIYKNILQGSLLANDLYLRDRSEYIMHLKTKTRSEDELMYAISTNDQAQATEEETPTGQAALSGTNSTTSTTNTRFSLASTSTSVQPSTVQRSTSTLSTSKVFLETWNRALT